MAKKKEQPIQQHPIRGGRTLTLFEFVAIFNPATFEQPTEAKIIQEAKYADGSEEWTIKVRFKHIE